MKKVFLSCLLILALSGCGGKKSERSANNSAGTQTEVSSKSDKSDSRKAKEEKQLEKDRKKLYDMRREYREMAKELDYIPDPMARSRHSDKMDRLNRQIGDLEVEMLQKYGKPY
ncbi:MAG: hypothetical protein J6Y40_04040 [Bacteroidales bacterium]|nr:hypothetical protein [Bacteroidales bacterium]